MSGPSVFPCGTFYQSNIPLTVFAKAHSVRGADGNEQMEPRAETGRNHNGRRAIRHFAVDYYAATKEELKAVKSFSVWYEYIELDTRGSPMLPVTKVYDQGYLKNPYKQAGPSQKCANSNLLRRPRLPELISLKNFVHIKLKLPA